MPILQELQAIPVMDARKALLAKTIILDTSGANQKKIALNPENLLELINSAELLALLSPSEWFSLYLDKSRPGLNEHKLKIANALMSLYQNNPQNFVEYLQEVKELIAHIKNHDSLKRAEQTLLDERKILENKINLAKQSLQKARAKRVKTQGKYRELLKKINCWESQNEESKQSIAVALQVNLKSKKWALARETKPEKSYLRSLVLKKINACGSTLAGNEFNQLNSLRGKLSRLRNKIITTANDIELSRNTLHSKLRAISELKKLITDPDCVADNPKFSRITLGGLSKLYQDYLLLSVAYRKDLKGGNSPTLVQFDLCLANAIERLSLALGNRITRKEFKRLFSLIEKHYEAASLEALLKPAPDNGVSQRTTATVSHESYKGLLTFLDFMNAFSMFYHLISPIVNLIFDGDFDTSLKLIMLEFVGSTISVTLQKAMNAVDSSMEIDGALFNRVLRKIFFPFLVRQSIYINFNAALSEEEQQAYGVQLLIFFQIYCVGELIGYSFGLSQDSAKGDATTTAKLLELPDASPETVEATRAGAGGAGAGSDKNQRQEDQAVYAQEEAKRLAEQEEQGSSTPQPKR
jgi:hypothetical protein